MNARKSWRPHLRDQPIFNPFEPSTDWTRDLGANDRVEIPDQEEETGTADPDLGKKSSEPPGK